VKKTRFSITKGYKLEGPSSIPGSARFFFLHSVQTGILSHTVSYPMGTGGSLFGVKDRGVKLTVYFHLVLRARKVELNRHSLSPYVFMS
jgi:hypothetical protein